MPDPLLFETAFDLSPLHGRRRGLVRCPFHEERTPSMSVDLDALVFHCFGCHVQGGLLKLQDLVLRHAGLEADALALGQRWADPVARELSAVQAHITATRREIARIRHEAADTPEGWAWLAHAADLERAVLAAEAEVDGAMGW